MNMKSEITDIVQGQLCEWGTTAKVDSYPLRRLMNEQAKELIDNLHKLADNISNIFAVIRTNCQGASLGQTIKLELYSTEKAATKALDKDNCGKLEIDGVMGYWNTKTQLWSYIKELTVKYDR
jgi:hypothetical protein